MSNMITVTGYLTKDAEVRNEEYVELNIADNPVGKAADRYETMFYRATFKLPNPVAEIAKDSKKGDLVVVSGQLQMATYKVKKGKNKGKTGVSLEIPFTAGFSRFTVKPKDDKDSATDFPPKDEADDDTGASDSEPAGDAFPGANE